jgi:hypothetical protein
MTAEDVTYLLFSPGALTYVRSLLFGLSGRDFETGRFLYRFLLPDTRRGNPRRVYTLGRRGRDYGEAVLGFPRFGALETQSPRTDRIRSGKIDCVRPSTDVA